MVSNVPPKSTGLSLPDGFDDYRNARRVYMTESCKKGAEHTPTLDEFIRGPTVSAVHVFSKPESGNHKQHVLEKPLQGLRNETKIYRIFGKHSDFWITLTMAVTWTTMALLDKAPNFCTTNDVSFYSPTRNNLMYIPLVLAFLAYMCECVCTFIGMSPYGELTDPTSRIANNNSDGLKLNILKTKKHQKYMAEKQKRQGGSNWIIYPMLFMLVSCAILYTWGSANRRFMPAPESGYDALYVLLTLCSLFLAVAINQQVGLAAMNVIAVIVVTRCMPQVSSSRFPWAWHKLMVCVLSPFVYLMIMPWIWMLRDIHSMRKYEIFDSFGQDEFTFKKQAEHRHFRCIITLSTRAVTCLLALAIICECNPITIVYEMHEWVGPVKSWRYIYSSAPPMECLKSNPNKCRPIIP